LNSQNQSAQSKISQQVKNHLLPQCTVTRFLSWWLRTWTHIHIRCMLLPSMWSHVVTCIQFT